MGNKKSKYTMEEVKENEWIIFKGRVYDVKPFRIF